MFKYFSDYDNSRVIHRKEQVLGTDCLIQIPIVKIFSRDPPNLKTWVYFVYNPKKHHPGTVKNSKSNCARVGLFWSIHNFFLLLQI